MTEYKVYKIINDDMPGLVYYGSTTMTLNNRWYSHKSLSGCTSKKLFEIGKPKMIQLSVFDNELDMYKKEKEYIVNNECLNVVIPSIKKKDYSKGKIYKIVNDDFPDLVYYGSTISELRKRFNNHKIKTNICASKKLFETNNAKIELVEDYPCETKRELEIREKYYILNFECLNEKIPGKTIEEKKAYQKEYSKKYEEKHKEQIKKTKKIYRIENRKKLRKYEKEYENKNKEKIALRKKNYRLKNLEEYTRKAKIRNDKARKIKYTCECGSTLSKSAKKKHERTKKHKNYLDTL